MYNYVRPNVVLTALRWLKVNNPLYANVIINNNYWFSDPARVDNEILWACLVLVLIIFILIIYIIKKQ